jgi:hypothetical protein
MQAANLCSDDFYCLFTSEHLNENPDSSQQMWMYDAEWKDFRLDPRSGKAYVPDPTNHVQSVLNRTDRNIHLMEWNFGAPGTVCLTVPPQHVVREVQKYGSDGGYGSVSFDDDLAQQYHCKQSDESGT